MSLLSSSESPQEKYIPNYNTLSTIIDRITIENVKIAEFSNRYHNEDINIKEKIELEQKLETQKEILYQFKLELGEFFEALFASKGYHYITEKRTFD